MHLLKRQVCVERYGAGGFLSTSVGVLVPGVWYPELSPYISQTSGLGEVWSSSYSCNDPQKNQVLRVHKKNIDTLLIFRAPDRGHIITKLKKQKKKKKTVLFHFVTKIPTCFVPCF